jgi:hypothetical protein
VVNILYNLTGIKSAALTGFKDDCNGIGCRNAEAIDLTYCNQSIEFDRRIRAKGFGPVKVYCCGRKLMLST